MAKKTYAVLQAEIEKLQAQAEAVRQSELDGVIARIREAIAFYGLKPQDLGFSPRAGVKATPAAGKVRRRRGAGAKRAAAGAQKAPKFRDGQGNVWVGRGPRPKWLREALASGKTLDDFAVR